MSTVPDYSRNDELFADFYGYQRELTGYFAVRPFLLRDWLDTVPHRNLDPDPSRRVPRSWRTARLSSARRRDLLALLEAAGSAGHEPGSLAAWLLEALPVRSYCEIAAAARPSLAAVAPAVDACLGRMLGARNQLFMVNYGLAKAAARRRLGAEYEEMLSAASFGLLDAVDRYVPGPRASRFAHFAGYWIRHHIDRRAQKGGCVVSFPVNQHRIGRRIHGILARRRARGLPPPSEAELCAELGLQPAAIRRHREKPHMVSLDAPSDSAPDAAPMEYSLCDPAPKPDAVLEEAEIAAELQAILRAHTEPATRVMLAYARGVGNLADAAEDYLASLRDAIRRRMESPGRFAGDTNDHVVTFNDISATTLPIELQC